MRLNTVYQLKASWFEIWKFFSSWEDELFVASFALYQGLPAFLRSRTTWAPRIVNTYHFF